MATTPESPAGTERDFAVRLDAVQADQVRRLAAVWGVTPEQVLGGLVANALGDCAAAVVDLIPGPSASSTRGH